MTTTSTTGYVDVDAPSEYSHGNTEEWTTLHETNFNSCPNRPLDNRRRLRKPRRPVRGDSAPASPEEVLARSEYNHTTTPIDETVPTWPADARGVRGLQALPRASNPSPYGAVFPDPQTTVPLSPHPPSSPVRSQTAAQSIKTLRKQRSMTKLVKEGMEKLVRCHGKGTCRKRDEWEHVYA
jgi:hypothetical protein